MRVLHSRHIIPHKAFSSLPFSLKRVSFVMFLYYVSWGLIEPFLPIYFNDLFGSYTHVGIVFSLLYLFSMILSIPFGDYTDLVSKRKLITIILFLYLPLGPILAVLKTLFHVILFRVYHAFLATGLWSSVESYVRYHSPRGKASQSIGFFDSAIRLSWVIGSIGGGIIATFLGIKMLFYLMPIFAVFALVAIARLPDHEGTTRLGAGLKKLLGKGVFRFEFRDFFALPGMPFITFLSFLLNIVAAATAVVLPLVLEAVGASFLQIGFIFAVFMLPSLFEAPFSLVADRFDKKTMLLLGAFGAVLIQFFMASANGIWTLFFLSLGLALAFAFLNPAIEGIVTNTMPRDKIGELNGVYRSFILLASALGSFVIGPVADSFTIQTPFLIGAFLLVVFLAATAFFPRRIFDAA